jgi:hypothetical protein
MLRVSKHWESDGKNVSMLMEDTSRNKCFSGFEYHIFYVLYPFLTCLVTLPRILWDSSETAFRYQRITLSSIPEHKALITTSVRI